MLLNNFTSRVKILKITVFAALAIITVRLFFIQIIEHDAWIARADEAHTLLETITAKRGEIYMMDKGEPVPIVLNQTKYQIIIDPAITEKDKLAEALEKYAKDYITADLEEVYSREGSRYAIVAKNVPREAATQIAEEEISAVWFQSKNQRVYPEGELASGLLGFVNADGIGQYGVEGSLSNSLTGKDGMLKTIADVNKVALSIGDDNVKIPAEDGKNIVLTVDRGLEKVVEEIAMEHINNTDATNAAVLVMNYKNTPIKMPRDCIDYKEYLTNLLIEADRRCSFLSGYIECAGLMLDLENIPTAMMKKYEKHCNALRLAISDVHKKLQDMDYECLNSDRTLIQELYLPRILKKDEWQMSDYCYEKTGYLYHPCHNVEEMFYRMQAKELYDHALTKYVTITEDDFDNLGRLQLLALINTGLYFYSLDNDTALNKLIPDSKEYR